MVEALFTVTRKGRPKAVVLTKDEEAALVIGSVILGYGRDSDVSNLLKARQATGDETARFMAMANTWRGEMSLAAVTWEQLAKC